MYVFKEARCQPVEVTMVETSVVELAAYRIELRSLAAAEFKTPPLKQMHAALHRELEAAHQPFGNWAHNASAKPLTLTPLRRAEGDAPVIGPVDAGTRVWLRVTALTGPAVDGMASYQGRARERGARFDLDWTPFQLVHWAPHGSPATYRQLLNRAEPAGTITLQFRSPTLFRHKNASLPPTPERVFGSFLRRWHAYSPLLDWLDVATLTQGIILEASDITWRMCVHVRAERAFVGWARYRVDGDDRFRRAVAALADYAAYCGTGARTGYGLGETAWTE